MEEDAGVGNEDPIEAKGHVGVLVEALMDWKVLFMALKFVVPQCYRVITTDTPHKVLLASLCRFLSTRSSRHSRPRLGITEL